MENKRFILLSTKGNGRSNSVAENGEDFRLIPLTQGKFAIVHAEDYDRLAQHKWCAVKGCSSRYKGVVRRGAYKRWRARIGFNGKRIHLGDFADEKQAAMAYDDKAAELFGEFAYLNFPERIELRNWIRKIIWAA